MEHLIHFGNNSRLWSGLTITLLLLIGSLPVRAQSGATTGALTGSVKDSQGAVVSGATIKVRQQETNLGRTVETNENGIFRMPNLPPGRYQAMVEASGFQSAQEIFKLNIGSS